MRVSSILVTLLSLFWMLPSSAYGQSTPLFDGDPATTERVDAGSAPQAALQISRARFAEGSAKAVVIARSDAFADALAGSALTRSAPLLLTPGDALDPAVDTEVRRAALPGSTVYLLGGESALSPAVASRLSEDYQVVRLRGATRIETAIAIAEEVRATGGDLGTVLLARAGGPPGDPTAAWADSLAGGAYAAALRAPILFTPTEQVHPVVTDALRRYDPVRTVLLGGTAALSETVEAGVPNAARVFGADRAGTASEVARGLWPANRASYVVVNGYAPDGWAYGLAAAGVAADAGAPLLLSQAESVPMETVRRTASPCGLAPSIDVLLIGAGERLGAAVADLVTRVDGGTCPDLFGDPLPLPPGEQELGRAVSGDFVVALTQVDEFTTWMHVAERVGGAVLPVASAEAHGESLHDLRTDDIGHVHVVLGLGAHSGTAHVWGFEGGTPRRYPATPEGYFTVTGVGLIDLNADGVLELRVYDNDYDPCYACGTTSWIDYGWSGADYVQVGGSPPLPRPQSPEAAVDGMLTAWRAAHVDGMYGYASANAVSTLLEAGPPMAAWSTFCYPGGDWEVQCSASETEGFLYVEFELTQKASGGWHIVTLYHTVL